jgi:hypothetical protein
MRAGIRAIRARLTSQQQGRQAVPCRARLVGRFGVGRQKTFQAIEGFQKAPLQGGCGAKWVSLWCSAVPGTAQSGAEMVARESESRIQQ